MSDEDPEEADLAALRRQIAEMEAALADAESSAQKLEEIEGQIGAVGEITHESMAITEKGVVLEVNQRFTHLFRYSAEEIIGRVPLDLHTPDVREEVLAKMLTGMEKPYESTCLRKDGTIFWAEIQGRAVLYHGRPARVTVIRDITDRKRAEEAERATLVQAEVLRAQQALLSALSTPLLPITEEILVLPLIGDVTADRAGQVIKTLVEGVARHGAKTAILDITGVPDVDAGVADALLHAARAVRLLGARVALTGIRPEVAQRFVMLGVELGELVTYGTLQQGIASEIRQCVSEQQRKPTS